MSSRGRFATPAQSLCRATRSPTLSLVPFKGPFLSPPCHSLLVRFVTFTCVVHERTLGVILAEPGVSEPGGALLKMPSGVPTCSFNSNLTS
jgi:hypothetical protein